MGVKVSNNAYGTLATAISAAATTITLEGGDGARFPALGAGDYFYATLIDTANNLEIVKVTARSVDSMTIVRGQEGTTAKAYALNDRLELRPVAALFNEKADTAYVDALGSGKLDYVAPGASGNVLISNGSNWTSQALSVEGRLLGYTVFTSSGVYTKATNNPRFVIVEAVGGGGGITGAGGTSSFGAFLSATGGAAAVINTMGANGGVGSGGDINLTGQRGSVGFCTTYQPSFGSPTVTCAVSTGGVSNISGAGTGASNATSASRDKAISQCASGGGGGYSKKKINSSSLASSETVTIGGAGAGAGISSATAGLVIVWEYA